MVYQNNIDLGDEEKPRNSYSRIGHGIRKVFLKMRSGRLNSAGEKRKIRRKSCKKPLYYKSGNSRIPWTHGRTINIESYGACVLVNHRFEIGEEIELEIINATTKTKGISHVLGKVVWIDDWPSPLNQYKLGITFHHKRVVFQRDNTLIWKMADKHCCLMKNYTKNCLVHTARNIQELKTVYHLVYREYVLRRLCKPDDSQMYYNPHSLLPQTQTFLLCRENKIMGTASLFPDSPCGIPMDSIFHDELAALRADGKKIAEAGMLALNSEYFPKKRHPFQDFQKQAYLFKLFKTVFDYARFVLKVDELIIGVHPKHKFLYEYLHFEKYGPVRSYSVVGGKPALLMKMNIDTVVRNNILLSEGPGVYFLSYTTPQEAHKRHFSWTTQTVRDFLVDVRPLWGTLKAQQKSYIEHCYPALNIC